MTTTTKKKTKAVKRKKRTAKQIKKDTTLNLFMKNPNSKSGFELVHLHIKYRFEFIKRFGLLESPTIEDYNDWVSTLDYNEWVNN